MKTKLSKKFCTGVIFLLITVCFFPAIAAAFTPGDTKSIKEFDGKDRNRPILGIWRDLQLIKELGLTPEQVKNVRDADFTFRENQLTLKAQLDGLRLQLDKTFFGDVLDEQALLALAEKIASVKGKLFVQDIESRLALGNVLNADQIKKLGLYDLHSERQGPKPGKKHISKHHPAE